MLKIYNGKLINVERTGANAIKLLNTKRIKNEG